MNDIVREDINENERLEDFVDTENVPYAEMQRLLTSFCSEVLLSEHILEENKTVIIMCKFLINQAIEFGNKEISLNEFVKSRLLAWMLHDSVQQNSTERHLFRLIVCLLYEEGNEPYSPDGYLEVFYSCLFDLDKGCCKKFTDYVIENINPSLKKQS